MAAIRMRPMIGAIGLLVTGAVLGPVVLALAHAVTVATFDKWPYGGPDQPADAGDSGARARYLFHAYQPHRPPAPPPILFADVQPEPWARCGYEGLGRQLYAWSQEGAKRGERYDLQSAALGQALMIAAHDAQDEAAVAVLARSTTDFSATFLAGCIEGTVLRGLCVARVTALLGGDKVRIPRALPDEHGILCTFYDGVAARSGVPLSNRP